MTTFDRRFSRRHLLGASFPALALPLGTAMVALAKGPATVAPTRARLFRTSGYLGVTLNRAPGEDNSGFPRCCTAGRYDLARCSPGTAGRGLLC